jgi:hypothetical protein
MQSAEYDRNIEDAVAGARRSVWPQHPGVERCLLIKIG